MVAQHSLELVQAAAINADGRRAFGLCADKWRSVFVDKEENTGYIVDTVMNSTLATGAALTGPKRAGDLGVGENIR